MTNKELIEKLRKLPQDAMILVRTDLNEGPLFIQATSAAVEKDENIIVIE